MIRPATSADLSAMLEIYTPYVTDTPVTFAYEPPTAAEFAARFRRITGAYPWLVLEETGELLGYAYADRAFEKAAYAWCAELTLYLRRDAVGQGRGRALYLALEEALIRQGIVILYALVTASNLPSLRFHAALGWREIGRLPASGWKQGQWHDVIWLEKRLRPAACPPPEPADARPRLTSEQKKTPGLTLRFASEADFSAVNRLRRQVNDLHAAGKPEIFPAGFGPELADYLHEILRDPDKDVVVAEEGDDILGFMILHAVCRPATPYMYVRRYLDIDEFCVDAAARRRGVGRALMDFARQVGRDRGFDRLELNMWEFNREALAFYEAMGFSTYRRYLELKLETNI